MLVQDFFFFILDWEWNGWEACRSSEVWLFIYLFIFTVKKKTNLGFRHVCTTPQVPGLSDRSTFAGVTSVDNKWHQKFYIKNPTLRIPGYLVPSMSSVLSPEMSLVPTLYSNKWIFLCSEISGREISFEMTK